MSEETPRLFGTDGIRGPFGEPPLDRRTVEQLAYHLAGALATNGRQPALVLGGDTRANTPELATWVAAGLTAGGVGYRYAGVIPTPGIAVVTRGLGLDGGMAISASHNPFPDNGLKPFDRQGFKWSREAESALEAALHSAGTNAHVAELADDLTPDPSLAESYLAHLRASLPGRTPLEGLTVALDCAHGAASPFAERLFDALGATTHVIGDHPDGTNINLDCGSTHPERLVELVGSTGADFGVAFDGDADRAILVDETGAIQDGDSVLYLWARELQCRGQLEPAALVATTMSNLGLEHALAALGIETVRCDVGDRVVVETMRERGIRLGGEQSGHIIHLDHGSTGDGLLTAIQIGALLVRSGETLSALAAPVERFPQILVNVRVGHKRPFDTLPSVTAKATSILDKLGSDGRLLLRYSGTEPLARVMIEGRDQEEIEALARDLAAEIGNVLGEEA